MCLPSDISGASFLGLSCARKASKAFINVGWLFMIEIMQNLVDNWFLK